MAIFRPAVLGTRRSEENGPLPFRALQTIAAADFVGESVSDWPAAAPAVEALDVVLVCEDHRAAGPVRVLVKAQNAPAPTDKIIIAANGA